MTAACNRDCFHCPFPDCIVDEMDAAERKAHREIDKDLFTDPEKKRIAAKAKAYREANREEIAARQKAYYEANREEIAARQKAYREANREEIAAYQKAYREANREEIAAYQKAYYEANRERHSRFGQSLRKARKARGYAQADLGRLFDVTRQAVCLWELGKSPFPADRQEMLTGIFPELAVLFEEKKNPHQAAT